MKYGIRSQLTLAFILVVVIPLAVTFGMLAIVSVKINSEPDFQHLAKPDLFFEQLSHRIEKNFTIIEDYDLMMAEMEPFLTNFRGYVQVVDIAGRVVFHSDEPTVKAKNITVPFDTLYGLDHLYEENYPGYNRYVKPLIIDRQLVGNSIFVFEQQDAVRDGIEKVFLYIILSFAAGVLSFILLMVLLTILISRTILVPLKELNVATEKVAQGDLTFTIDYAKKNELGRFCEAFTNMKEQLKAALQKQKEEENAKKELIASISHDLRTPMTSIKGYVEGLKDGKAKDEETFNRYLAVIERKTESLDRLIDDLSLFSRVELGKMDMHFQVVDSRWMLDKIADSKELDFDNPETSVLMKRPFPSVLVNVDIERITQVVDNLFENAKKYSLGQCIIIMEASMRENFLQVCIKDNGEGISSEDLPHIFDLFYRGEKSRSREYGGTGLGLAICKYIIEEHGGKIWAKSRRRQGTEVCFSVPLAEKG